MKITKSIKIIGIIALSVLLLAIVVNVAINLIIKNQLPNIIEDKNDTAYNLVYSDMSFSIFSNSLSIENVELTPKKQADIKKDIDFFGKVERISVTGVNFYELIKNKNLKAYTISVIGPEITVLKPAVRDTLKSESKLSSVIDIDKIRVQKAHLRMVNATNDTLFHEVFNFNAEINGIHMGKYTAQKDIPFTYTDYTFKIDSFYSRINDLQIVKSEEVAIDKDQISVTNFRMLPYKSSKEFKQNSIQTNTRILAKVPKLKLINTDWGYHGFDLFVKIKNIEIDSINVQILDQKNKTALQEAQQEKEKKNQPLIPFQLDVDELNIKKSAFNSLGILDVSNVDIKIKKISNKVNQHLLIDEFQLNNPKFVHVPKKNPSKKTSQPNKLNDLILINKVSVNNANYVLKDQSAKYKKLTVNNFNLTLNDIRVDDKTVLENVPFMYKNPLLTTGEIHFDTGKDYNIQAAGIVLKQANASVKNFKMIPKISRKQHAAKLKYAQDYYNLSANELQFNNFTWGFDAQNEFFVKFKEVFLNNMDAQIYRDVSVPLNPKENYLYSYRLRNLKFPFEIQTLKIKNSKLSYEEDTATSTNPGKLTFANFNLTATNLYSGYKRSNGPKTQIFVTTKFMQQGDLVVSWQFDIMDRSEKFNINGNLKNFPAPAMNPFLKPYLKVQANGKIDHMAFNFSGNNNTASGQYAMNFNNLKMKLLNKENKERKFLTAAANMVVRSNTDGFKKVEIKPVDRTKEKSFFNYLWQCIMQGLKQTVI